MMKSLRLLMLTALLAGFAGPVMAACMSMQDHHAEISSDQPPCHSGMGAQAPAPIDETFSSGDMCDCTAHLSLLRNAVPDPKKAPLAIMAQMHVRVIGLNRSVPMNRDPSIAPPRKTPVIQETGRFRN